jgi:hypothetical protein
VIRVRAGRWDHATTARHLLADAVRLALGDAPAFAGHRPGRFVSDRTPS